MKKAHILVLLCITIFSILFAGCGKKIEKELIGTWYSTKPDTIVIKENGKYTSDWITSGLESNYTVEGKKIIFTNPLGDEYEFEIIESNNDYILEYKSKTGNLNYSYYKDKKLVDEMIAQIQKEKELIEIEESEKEQSKKQEIAEILVGIWEWSSTNHTVEFTVDGKHIHNISDDIYTWEYEIIDSNTLKITTDDGKVLTKVFEVRETDNGYELIYNGVIYTKK